MSRLIPEILSGQQDLCDGVIVRSKQLVINVHELALADCGRSLLGGHVGGALCEVQLPDSHADGPRRDQDNLMPGVLYIAEDLAEGFYMPDIHPSGGVCQGRGTDLYHNSQRYHLQTICHSNVLKDSLL